jgi:tetratricopeptide (TPR) repeat protein
MKKALLAVALMAVLSAGSPAVAQTVSELLQKGIYTQETLGDLDGAVKIYKQLLAAAKENRGYAAQAQYRLGVCLLAKGDTAEATKAFQAVIDNYPEQKDLVEKARERMPWGLKLLPAPWTDGEVLELNMKMAGGMAAGAMVFSIDAAPGDPAHRWLAQYLTYTMATQQICRVTMDRDSLQPVSSSIDFVLGQFRVEYQGRQAQIWTKGQDNPRTIDLEASTYDNSEWLYLLRRMPLAPGFKVTVPILGATGVAVKAVFEVAATEDVEVPAGKFRCYKIQLNALNQTFWISTDGPRYLVKLEMNGVLVAELSRARTSDPGPQRTFRDDQLGFSLAVPGDWLFMKFEGAGVSKPGGPVTVLLFDPQATATGTVRVEKKQTQKDAIESGLKSQAEEYAGKQAESVKDYKVREGSWQSRQIGGHAALSYVADLIDPVVKDHKLVEYVTWVRSESLSARVQARLEPGELEKFQKRFDPILESLQLR